ncbi:DUF6205 family protein [Streptomyces platensis]|uniref:DUF6205 family protein n=1 Tax=Streptomyces platensis TaxID=58346 RepID=UPI0037A2A5EC
MGYCTRVTGEFTITPPLTWSEIKDSPYLDGDAHTGRLDVKLSIAEEQVDTKDGPLLRRSAAALVPAWDDSFKAYDLIDHVQDAIDSFPGHAFTGRLECEGEEAGDLWRVVIRDGRAVRIEPRIIWPEDGAE